jgi:hypothetical protein
VSTKRRTTGIVAAYDAVRDVLATPVAFISI